jgi:hypothetical protein
VPNLNIIIENLERVKIPIFCFRPVISSPDHVYEIRRFCLMTFGDDFARLFVHSPS